jgi:hypothetical protein
VLRAELEVFGEREEAGARDTLSHGAERVEAGYEPRKGVSRGARGTVGGVGAVWVGNSASGEDPGVDVVVALFVNHQVEVAPLALFDLEVGAVDWLLEEELSWSKPLAVFDLPRGVKDENFMLRLPPLKVFPGTNETLLRPGMA